MNESRYLPNSPDTDADPVSLRG